MKAAMAKKLPLSSGCYSVPCISHNFSRSSLLSFNSEIVFKTKNKLKQSKFIK